MKANVAPEPELVLHLSEVPPGQGLLDFDAVFAACRNLGEGAALIVEHLDAGQVPAALDFVKETAPRYQITFDRHSPTWR